MGGLAIFAGLQCTENPVETAQGGGGSEAVALIGSFEYPDHRPAIGASVRLRPKLFLSDTDAGTEAQGNVIDVKTDADS